MTRSSSENALLARQALETDRLLGVDFVPFRPLHPMNVPVDGDSQREESPVVVTVISGSSDSRLAALEALRARHEAECPHCTCVTGHTQLVFGEGNPGAEMMFIGEAPGEEEDRTGRPFVGRAGQKLDEIVAAMGMARADVYIANILKSRPPQNRTPLPNEVDACAPFLAEQIRIIQPKVIVALGGPASKWLLQTDTGITRLRGQWYWYEREGLRIPVMPTFHPAYLLRNYTLDTRKKVWSDMQEAKKRMREGG